MRRSAGQRTAATAKASEEEASLQAEADLASRSCLKCVCPRGRACGACACGFPLLDWPWRPTARIYMAARLAGGIAHPVVNERASALGETSRSYAAPGLLIIAALGHVPEVHWSRP